jgi:hypothetical protein
MLLSVGTGALRGQAVDDGAEGSTFFFEKKSQKTFIRLKSLYGDAPQRKRIKVFLLLFLQKKKTSFLAFNDLAARPGGSSGYGWPG